MELQRYSNPNANTTWPEWTGYEATRKTQRNVIEGSSWPAGEIDEVSTRYIEFGVTSMPETRLDIDEISFFLCGCGGNGMCVHVYYSTNDDFSDQHLIYSQEKLPANNMQYVKEVPVLSVENGQSLRLRFYPWYNTSATGKTICLSDIHIHGYSSALGTSAIESLPAAVQPVVATDYYTLDGKPVAAPESRGCYIGRSRLADGTLQSVKLMK